MLGRQDRCSVGAGVDLMSEDAHDQVRALRKVAVNSPDAQAGFLCDFSHGRIDAGAREHRHGRVEQRLDVALCVGAHASLGVSKP